MRARVNERLRQASRFPVTLVVAPAGFGKSVALRDFIASSGIDAIQLDVRREDGTLLSFVRRLSEAFAGAAPGALASFPAMQERVLAAQEPVRQLSDWFAEHLKDASCTIVIDDLHYAAADPASIALLSDLIERTSRHIRWIVAARADVGLPVATWVAYGRMDLPLGEDDLRLTTEEALRAAEGVAATLDPHEVEALRRLTEGWPVALTIALRTRTHATDLRTAAFSTREMVYRYLAEQVFTTLSPEQRAFALASAVFSAFDRATAQALGATPVFLDEFRSKVAFLHETEPGEFRYHDLFRDFLESELRRGGEREWTSALCTGARLLDERGEKAAALALYTRARASADIARMIERDGFALFARGESEKLADALEMLPDEVRWSSAAATGLRAMIDASLGRFEVAQPAYLAAIGLAKNDADLRLRLVHQYALELVRLDRDCVAFLEPYALDESVAPRYRSPLLSTLATGYLRAGRAGDARAAAESALELLDASVPEESRARVYQQAAYVERYAGSTEAARTYAARSIELALAGNLFDVAARAYSVLYTIVREGSENPPESLGILERLSECARKGASVHARLFALAATYEIEVERGDDETLARLDEQLQDHAMLPSLRSTTLLSVEALRAAWEGDFQRAYRMLAETSREQSTPEQRALRAAEAALYATASGLEREAHAEMQDAAADLEQAQPSNKHAVRARLTLALAHMLKGHDAAANRLIAEAERALTPAMGRMRAFAQAVRAVYRARLGQENADDRLAALERLRSEHFGGIARLLDALPVTNAQTAYAALTPSEREVLQLLARGASTKDVAARTGRSPYTVDTHIRSICRKLGCSGRREAVALASSQGWVEG